MSVYSVYVGSTELTLLNTLSQSMLENSTHLPLTRYDTFIIVQFIEFLVYYLSELGYYKL